jgi:ribosome-associated toxin RatA of RatAB toxin-antitoxin module
MANITMHRTVDAPVAVVWDVITDHELYGEIAPNLSTVEVVEGEDDRLIRRCVDTNGNEWTESCTRWEEQRAYAVAVDIEHSDFHRRLFTQFDGEWRVSEDDDGVRITISFEFEPRYGPLGSLISTYFAYKAPDIIEPIFDSWEGEVESRIADATGDDHHEPHGDRNVNALY